MEETRFGRGERAGVWGGPDGDGLAGDTRLELELGGLVAALSASTEDELELDLRLRALVEGGRHRVTIGSAPHARALGN